MEANPLLFSRLRCEYYISYRVLLTLTCCNIAAAAAAAAAAAVDAAADAASCTDAGSRC